VIDAIPYNGALLYKNGIVTAFNSDDAEMARRLNQEAAKAVKYGNVPEEEALKFVTLNPAKLLHIDAQVGSIKIGKDADLVLWNGPPLSVYSKPEQTYVDGVLYFDLKRDEELRKRDEAERNRLIRKMQDEKAGGGSMQRPSTTLQEEYHCNDLEHLPH
jgi:adenine deaminase